MIKVWVRSMNVDVSRYDRTPDARFDFTAYVDKHDLPVHKEATNMLKLGEPVYLVSKDELDGSKEIERLQKLVESIRFERDRAQDKVLTLKAVVNSLMERI